MQSELKQISNLALFAKVVQVGGISSCASSLGMERTTVSRRIADLEKSLGVKLLNRSPKAIAVTEAGRQCFDKCEEILELARSAESAATNGRRVINADPIFVASPPDLLERFVSPVISEFEDENPNAAIDCIPVFRASDELPPAADFMISWEKLDTSRFVISQIGAFAQAVYASLDYISKVGVPKSPYELHQHKRVGVATIGQAPHWAFLKDGNKSQVTTTPDIEVSNMQEAISSAMAGLGVCMLPRFLCDRHVEAGRLVHILPDYELLKKPLYLITERRSGSKPRLSRFRLLVEQRVGDIASGSIADEG